VRPTRTVVIAGGGIGGLSAALGLAKVGFRCVVLERTPALGESGAGIQLGPNAGKALAWLGIANSALDAVASQPERLEARSGRSGRRLTSMRLGERAARRFGAPYRTLRRADLQQILFEAVHRHPDIDLQLGTELAEFSTHANGVSAIGAGASRHREIRGQALIAADGVGSTVRKVMPGASEPRFTGWRAWRAVVPAPALSEFADAVTVWMGPNAHLVHYPIRSGAEINLVAIVKEPLEAASTGPRDLLAHFRGWSAAAQAVLAVAPSWTKRPIMTVDPRGAWHHGPVALLGDAAHAFPPYLAQGGAFAIEDAVMLAVALSRHADDPADGLREYRVLRYGRTRRLFRAANGAGGIYHMGRATAWTRDLTLMVAGPLLLHRYDWIYRWAPPD
jgi:salicylate hydroxylase